MSLSNILKPPAQSWATLYANSLNVRSVNLNNGALTNVGTINGNKVGDTAAGFTYEPTITAVDGSCTIDVVSTAYCTYVNNVLTITGDVGITPNNASSDFVIRLSVPDSVTVSDPDCNFSGGFVQAGTPNIIGVLSFAERFTPDTIEIDYFSGGLMAGSPNIIATYNITCLVEDVPAPVLARTSNTSQVVSTKLKQDSLERVTRAKSCRQTLIKSIKPKKVRPTRVEQTED